MPTATGPLHPGRGAVSIAAEPDLPKPLHDLGGAPTTRGAALRGTGTRTPGLGLLVVGEGTSTVHPLPARGSVIIGRSEQADVTIDDPSMSRGHARLHLGETVEIEDLGSANGTVVRAERLEPGVRVELRPGEAIELGATVAILQGRHRSEPERSRPRPRRIVSHDYFELRLEEECRTADRLGTSFAVMHVVVPDETGLSEALDTALRAQDVVARYGPSELEVLLIDADAHVAESIAQRLDDALGDGEGFGVGFACFPADARAPEALLARALDEARGNDEEEAQDGVVVQDRAMVRLHSLVERVARSQISVMLLGETGVGKEILAAAVHRASDRASGPYVKFNCASLTDSLFESELFGHEKGAFTGAVAAKPGLLETADGGTVFLDEVGEMPLGLQAKLLTVIEDRRVQRVGALRPKDIDVRFVCATNRDLEAEIEAGRFRQDLYYRLNGISLVIPPLRERPGEILPLARAFVARAAEQSGLPAPTIGDRARRLLTGYRWPGNIRELKNVMERAALLSGGESIEAEHLPVEKLEADRLPTPEAAPPRPAPAAELPGRARDGAVRGDSDAILPLEPTPSPTRRPPAPSPSEPRKRQRIPPEGSPEWEAERLRILGVLEQCVGNQSIAARMLGVSRRTLVTWLGRYRIPRPRKSFDED